MVAFIDWTVQLYRSGVSSREWNIINVSAWMNYIPLYNIMIYKLINLYTYIQGVTKLIRQICYKSCIERSNNKTCLRKCTDLKDTTLMFIFTSTYSAWQRTIRQIFIENNSKTMLFRTHRLILLVNLITNIDIKCFAKLRARRHD